MGHNASTDAAIRSFRDTALAAKTQEEFNKNKTQLDALLGGDSGLRFAPPQIIEPEQTTQTVQQNKLDFNPLLILGLIGVGLVIFGNR